MIGRRWLALSTATCALLTHSTLTEAWDSSEEPRVRSFPPDYRLLNLSPQYFPERRFGMEYLKDALQDDIDGTQRAPTKVIKCEAGGPFPEESLAQCTLATPEDLLRTNAHWLSARLAGSAEHHSEHTLIAREAARRAGLLRDVSSETGPTIFEPFWVRYPSENALVGSAIRRAPEAPANSPFPGYLFGQSFKPRELTDSEISFVARGISLLELAQLPDYSHSLSDWALGNESCPIPGTHQAYRGADPIEACHSFTAVMGAINVTHFKPLNREMWQYYHQLALDKMAECQQMASIRQSFYGDWDNLWPEYKLFSDANTEVHECERLAMAHEMFAQHFLQDAWSSGHMWMRWGYPRFTDFDTDVDLLLDRPRADFPARNEQPRRALIAATVGGISGMIHGAKSVLVDLVRDKLGRYIDTTPIIASGVLDDPLNSGRFGASPVRWKDGASVDLYPGAGDLYWDPQIITGVVVSNDESHAEQRTRLLDCAAASMLEVYRRAGPRAHGDELEVAAPAVNPASEHCWGQWATNVSMVGSLGPVDLSYLRPPSGPPPVIDPHQPPDYRALVYPAALSTVNTLTIERIGTSIVDFPTGTPEEIQDDELRARAVDRDVILRRVAAAVVTDIGKIRAVYTRNAEDAPQGTHSARQQEVDEDSAPGSLLLIGVPPPIEQGGDPPPWPRGVDYVDGIGPGVVPESDEALSRMFWRGDLYRTCAASAEGGAVGLYELKSRCVEAAQFGGDPESCTACVALAELHIPTCNTTPHLPVLDSKCSAAGISAVGLPSWWFDNVGRTIAPEQLPAPFHRSSNACSPALHMALQWCTDAPNEEGALAAKYRSYLGEYARVNPVDCGSDPVLGPITGGAEHWRERTARLLIEAAPTRAPWLFPMATAYDYDVDWTPISPCSALGRSVTSRDSILQASVAPASAAEFVDWNYASGRVPRCGVTQRLFYWNRSCNEVQNVMVGSSLFDPSGGGSLSESLDIVECNARVKREYANCPAGFACTAGGECVAGGQTPQFVFLQSDPE